MRGDVLTRKKSQQRRPMRTIIRRDPAARSQLTEQEADPPERMRDDGGKPSLQGAGW